MNENYIYILANRIKGSLYIGVTGNLIKRIYEHKNNIIKGFSNKYKIHKLVYYKKIDSIISAIQREKRMKKWKKQWKIELIEKVNPNWNDLYEDILRNL